MQPIYLSTFPNLCYLNLSVNPLRQIKQKKILGLELLKILYLGNNQITLISNYPFNSITNLTYLNLAVNQVELKRVESWIYSSMILNDCYRQTDICIYTKPPKCVDITRCTS